MVQAAMLPRSAIATEHTWDMASVFPSAQAWDAAFKEVEAQLADLGRFKGSLDNGPPRLAEWFDAYQRAFRALGHVMIYANMGHTADTTDQEAAARFDRARGLMARATGAAAFADPEIVAIGFQALRGWVREDSRLAMYAHYLDRLERRQPHVRTAEVEELLGYVLDPFRTASATHGVLADADLTFGPAHATGSTEPVDVMQGNLSRLQTDPDREIRRTAWESYADAHLANKNAMANCIAAGVKQDVFMARSRRYGSSLEAALLPNHIPVDVFHNLIAVFRRNLPTWHRYWRVRRRALGYDRLFPYDRSASLGATKPKVPFAQSVEWICQGMQPLGDEYASIMRRGLLEQRWVDVYPNKGKRSGAFSAGSQGTHPFILMSYTDDIFSMSTLAHEIGHSMHSYYSWKTQPFIYARYPLFLAEVASNFNQAMVRAHLLATNTDPDVQLAVLEEAMSNFYRYFFVMPTLARFELETHQRVERGEALTARSLIDLTAQLLTEGYGGEVEVDHDRIGIMWAEFPTHLYMNFYVFQYSTGISGAHALAERVLAGTPGAVDSYLAFLKAGGSKLPLDALQDAGVDLSTPEPVERAFAILARTVDRLDLLLAKRSGKPS